MSYLNELGVFYAPYKLMQMVGPDFLGKVCSFADQTHGWLSPHQTSILYLCSFLTKGKIVEVGCWKGKSTTAIGLGADPNATAIFVVDSFEGDSGHKAEFDVSTIRPDFDKQMERVGLTNRIIVQPGFSIEVAKQHEDDSVSMLFLDAAHEYDSVKEDILAWSPKLKSGGKVYFHDYPADGDPNGGFEELKQAVDEEVRFNKNFKDFGHCYGLAGAEKV